MTTPLMSDSPRHDEQAADRDAISERVRAHRARRARVYGRDRNEAQLEASIEREALEFQSQVQQGMRDAS